MIYALNPSERTHSCAGRADNCTGRSVFGSDEVIFSLGELILVLDDLKAFNDCKSPSVTKDSTPQPSPMVMLHANYFRTF